MGVSMKRPLCGAFVTLALCCLSVQLVHGRYDRQEYCTDVSVFDNIHYLEELNGQWYILGMSNRANANFTCFTWNVAANQTKARVLETVKTNGEGLTLNENNIFQIFEDHLGKFSIKKPNWAINRHTDIADLIGVSLDGDRAILVRCRVDERHGIVVLSRDPNDQLVPTLESFNLPTSLGVYDDLELLDQTGCDLSAVSSGQLVATSVQTENEPQITAIQQNGNVTSECVC